MFKATKLLKVVSVLLIIGGVIGLGTSLFMKPIMNYLASASGVNMSFLTAEITTVSIILGVLSAAISIVCGVLAFMGKGYKIALVGMLLIVVYQLYSTITATINYGVTVTLVGGFILPVLYLWGLYQSKE